MSYTIRRYADADHDWVLAAEVALQAHERAIHDTRLPAEPASSRAYLAKLFEALAEGHGVMLIAEDALGRRVGLVAGRIIDEPWPVETPDSTRHGYVDDIYIDPDARGTGLAQMLLDAIADHLRHVDPNLTRLRINVLAVNRIARRSYEKAGFVPYEVMYERRL